MRRCVVVAVLSALVGSAIVLFATPAGAHAAYKFSSPDDESSVSEAPTEIWAEYTEPPTDASYMKVFDPCGTQVDNSDSRADPTQNRVYITQSSAHSGTYEVEWFVDSAADAHSTRGTFTFTVTKGDPCPGSEPVEEEKETRSEPRDTGRERDGEASAPSNDDGGDQTSAASTSSNGDSKQTQDTSGTGDRDRAKDRSEARSGGGDRGAGNVAAPEPEPEEPGLFEDIPIGGLVIALAMSAGIGAAGGVIYAGIMGYQRG